MAKNLKIKVKNTQLAAALQLQKKKKENAVKASPSSSTAQKKVVRKAVSKEKDKPVVKEEKVESKPPSPVTPKSPPPPPTTVKAEESKPPPSPSPKIEKAGETTKKKDSLETLKKRDKEKVSVKEEQEEGFRAQVTRKTKEFKVKQQQGRQGFDARDRQGLRVGEEMRWRRRRPRQKTKPKTTAEILRPKKLSVHLPISIKDLAQAMKRKASELLAKLFLQGVTLTINDVLEDDTAVQLLGHEFGCEIDIDTSEEKRLRITDKSIQEEIKETNKESLTLRAPIIAFMGHVDHGKTSLIDVIRKSNIANTEAGAITQHIGAFQCHRKEGNITILDTPGHAAFTSMRKRGAAITDLIVLVIAGDEGIMPQTEEAIAAAKAANVPLLVAINKSDKPSFNPDTIYRQLADHDLLPESWGGEVITVNCSAATGDGIPQLLEMLILQSEILELKANPDMRARGTVIESELHKGFGAIATLIVQNGTLKLGDAIVFDDIYARVKTMHDEHGKLIQTAAPSSPVKITGLSGVPLAGCEFIVVENEKEARKLCEQRASGAKRSLLAHSRPEGLETLLKKHREQSEKKVLNLIIRADVQGSLEAIKSSLLHIQTKKVDLHFISEGVGEISESDVELAMASSASILGFHTEIENHANSLIKRSNIVVKNRKIIYQLVDDVKELMLSTLDKIRQEDEVGTLEVKQTFKVSHLGVIAGGQVIDGMIKRNHHVKVLRDNEIIWKGDISSLKRVKEDVKEVSKGLECGILLDRFNDVQVGDHIKAFEITYINQEL